jgi:hypothetical protein
MESRFDQITKLLAESIPRREALRRLGGLFGGAILASLGWGNRAKAGEQCEDFCKQFHLHGEEHNDCLKECRRCLNAGNFPCGLGECCESAKDCCVNVCCFGSQTCCGGLCCPGFPLATCCGGKKCCSPEQCCSGECCAAGEACINGACTAVAGCIPPCEGALPTCCNGICTNTSFDNLNCGSCGHECNVSMGQFCLNGNCFP